MLSALAAVAVAGGAYGVVAIATDDDGGTKPNAPAVTKVDAGRVLDGSPILRGTANRVDSTRVLDGSPILRGVTPSIVSVPHPRLDGAPSVTTSSNDDPTALQTPMRRPEGFHSR